MANKVVLKRSSVEGRLPTTSDLALGELALNTFDGNLFFKKDNGTASIVSTATLNGTQTLTNKTLTSPVVGGTATSASGNIVVKPATSVLEVQGYVEANAETSQTFVITVANNGYENVFVVDGVNNPTLSFVRTGVYTFDQSDATNSGHPIAFKDGAGASYTTGVVSTGTPGSAGAQTVITVSGDAPADLRYYCTVHGNGMGNTISVTGTGGAEIPGQIQLNCPVNTHGQKIASQPHSQAATNTLTLPGGTIIGNANAVLVSNTGTQTLTNKTLNSAVLTGTLTAGGGVGTAGQLLSSTSTGVQWISNPISSLNNLTDVTLTSPQVNQILKFNGAVFVNSDPEAQAVSSVVFAANAESDLGFVTAAVTSSEDNGLVADAAVFVFNLGTLVVDGIVSLNNLDQSVKADYISYAIIFGF